MTQLFIILRTVQSLRETGEIPLFGLRTHGASGSESRKDPTEGIVFLIRISS